MSKYTTEVRQICETIANSDVMSLSLEELDNWVMQTNNGYVNKKTAITLSAPAIFSSDFGHIYDDENAYTFPIFDEDYRLTLEYKILDHYYMREIGDETVGLWLHHLNERMNLIMPFYNQLYESTLIEFNPMQDIDLQDTHTQTNAGETSDAASTVNIGSTTSNSETNTTDVSATAGGSTEKTNALTYNKGDTSGNESTISNDTVEGNVNHVGHSTTAYSDTPQGSLTNVENLAYLTNATVNDDTSTDESTQTDAYGAKKETAGESENTETLAKGVETNYSEEKQETGLKTVEGRTSSSNETVSSAGGTSNTTEEYIRNLVGKRSYTSYSKYLLEFRETFLNIDKMIIDELADLFINLW